MSDKQNSNSRQGNRKSNPCNDKASEAKSIVNNNAETNHDDNVPDEQKIDSKNCNSESNIDSESISSDESSEYIDEDKEEDGSSSKDSDDGATAYDEQYTSESDDEGVKDMVSPCYIPIVNLLEDIASRASLSHWAKVARLVLQFADLPENRFDWCQSLLSFALPRAPREQDYDLFFPNQSLFFIQTEGDRNTVMEKPYNFPDWKPIADWNRPIDVPTKTNI